MDPTAKAEVSTIDAFNSLTAQTFGENAERTLRHEEEEKWDLKLVDIARQRLTAVKHLQQKGLMHPLGGMGDIISMYERVGDSTPAKTDMDGVTPGQDDILTFDEVGVPIPIIHKDFILNHRQMAASMKRGEPLSTTGLAVASRLVMDQMEEMVFNGLPDLVVDGRRVFGYTTHPDRLTFHISDWAALTRTTAGSATIVNEVNQMLKAQYAQHRYGPFTLYVANDLWAVLQLDYSEQKGDNTIMQRIMAFKDIASVEPGDSLAEGTVVMVALNEETVDYAVAQDIVQIQWSTNPFQTRYKVWSCSAPRIKADRNGSCALLHAHPDFPE